MFPCIADPVLLAIHDSRTAAAEPHAATIALPGIAAAALMCLFTAVS